ncbi:MAG: DEAD/DEAH box helicase [Desulfobulbaceae bacterium]|jgi:ATP-dependent RNA helicase RhlB|nr:DEAD/DEAH box helicase [Desulfobulbaceae bacterium]
MIKNFLQQAIHHLKKFVFTGRKNPTPVTHTAVTDDEQQAEGGRPRSPRRRKGRNKGAAIAPLSGGSTVATSTEDGWRPEDFIVPPQDSKSRFHDLLLPPPLMRGIYEQGFEYCTPIQDKALPAVLAGKNLIGKANTGTGKSAVFLLTIFARILEIRAVGEQPRLPLALVIAPTRELVAQIAKDGAALGKYCGARVVAVYGGAELQEQERRLRQGAEVVAATPGRLLDFLQRGALRLDHCRILVIDEADRMLDMGFIPDVRRIVGQLPKKETRQTMLFSATVSDDVRRLAAQWCIEPEYVEAEPEQVAQGSIEQRLYLVSGQEKFVVLYNFLRLHPDRRALIFANMKSEVHSLAQRLAERGIDCAELSGDVPQDKRERRLERFRSGGAKILIATDVAGRGLHIDQVSYVVNYTLPNEAEDYVHRIGRTGRAGAAGVAISFADEEGAFMLPEIENYIGHSLPCITPDEELLAALPPKIEKSGGEASGKPAARTRRRRGGRPSPRR